MTTNARDAAWWKRVFPSFVWLRHYERDWFRLDIAAGITLAAYLLPAGLADASLANLPPEAGLYACLFGGLVFWLFCSSRHTVISVTSAISLLVGASLDEIAGGNTARFGALAAGTAVLVGLIALIAWLVKAGVIVNFISESVMTGFKAGVALFLASTQLPKLFGIHGAHGSFWVNSGHFFKHLNETNPTSLLLGSIALAVLVLGKLFLKNKPVALFVVIGAIVAASALSLDTRGVKLLGNVPQGLPPLGMPAIHWDDLNELLPLAFACFLLGAVETAAIGRMFVAKHGGRFDANQEFLALAASNLAAGVGGGFPISGGMSQSLVNEGAGARTPLSNALAAGIILIVVLFFSHLLSALPHRCEKNRTTIRMMPAASAFESGVRAPAPSLTSDCDMPPLMGKPPPTPAARFDAASARNSWLASKRPPCFATNILPMAAVSTAPRRKQAKASGRSSLRSSQ